MSGIGDSKSAGSGQLPAPMAIRTPAVRREGALAVGATAAGALALGALALGAVAVGRVAIGQLALGRARLRSGQVGELRMARVIIQELRVEHVQGKRLGSGQ